MPRSHKLFQIKLVGLCSRLRYFRRAKELNPSPKKLHLMKTSRAKTASYNVQNASPSSSSRKVSPSMRGTVRAGRQARIITFKSISPAPRKKWLAAAGRDRAVLTPAGH